MRKQYPSCVKEHVPEFYMAIRPVGSYFERALQPLKAKEESRNVLLGIGMRGNCKCDAADVNPSQHVLYCSRDRGWNITTQVGCPQHPEARCDIRGKVKVGYQFRAGLVQAQLDAAEVWKGNGRVIASRHPGDTQVDEECFQKRATAEHIQNGLS